MKLGAIAATTVNNGSTFLQIPASATTALAPFDCIGQPPLWLVTPAEWLAASVTFQVLPFLLYGVSYVDNLPANNQLAPVYDQSDAGILYTIATGAGYGYYRLPPALFSGVQFINITSSVAQTNAPKVTLVLSAMWQGIHA